ncbi:MAG TPA: type II toxin-antitoxin system RelE/ParE family toxin [Spongiibacteraceae bacterium]
MIVWSKPAREDLRLIHQYIANDSKRYATRVIQDIAGKVEDLLKLPHLGRAVPEIGEDNVREISMYSYRIIYEVTGVNIYIHGVFINDGIFSPKITAITLPRF